MANKKFTDTEMRILRESGYGLSVSPDVVHFSVDFKRRFWEELSRGKMPREIVSNLGIDPGILGYSRMNGLKTMICREMKKGGFSEVNHHEGEYEKYLSSENRIKNLETELKYKNQEIEFLKKIVALGSGAES